MIPTEYQEAFNNFPIEAAVMPFPKPEITPHVTKINFMLVYFRKIKKD
jgi:hypothetical protein